MAKKWRGQIIDDPDDIAAVTVMWETLKAEALSRSACAGVKSGELGLF